MNKFLTLIFALLITQVTYGQNCSTAKKKRTTRTTSTSTTTTTESSSTSRTSSYQGRTYSNSRSNCSRTYTRSSNCTQPKTMRYVCSTRVCKKEEKITRFALQTGLNAHYTLAPATDNGSATARLTGDGTSATPNTPISLQADAFLGYRFKIGKHKHAIGVWGTGGFRSAGATERLLNQQEVEAAIENGWNDFREIEASLLIGERFRLGTGIGQQRYSDEALGTVRKNYYTSTAGFQLPLSKTVSLNTGMTMLWGKDLQRPALRPSTGVMMNLSK